MFEILTHSEMDPHFNVVKAIEHWYKNNAQACTGGRTCSDLLYKLPKFFKFHELNRNSNDHVAEVLLVYN